MGIKTKVDWCDSTWNPVTGCEHRCPYCYAKGIAERFGTNWLPDENPDDYKCVLDGTETHAILELDGMQVRKQKDGRIVPAAFPLGFAPTLHRYRLDEPQHWKKPRNIFVCSMADLFGDWVPDEWIEEVFQACEAAPQHRYMFLTKNPARFKQLRENGIKLPDGCWIGTSVTRDAEQADQYTGRTRYLSDNWDTTAKWFVSVEPIQEQMSRNSIENLTAMHWLIIGAETGNRKGKVVPRKEWIDEIAEKCKCCRTPIFMKESLRDLMGADFRQEFPWEAKKCR